MTRGYSSDSRGSLGWEFMDLTTAQSIGDIERWRSALVSIKYGTLSREMRLPDDRSAQLDGWSNSWTRDSRGLVAAWLARSSLTNGLTYTVVSVSTEWVRLGAFTSDADRRRKWPRRCGDATREERRIFRVGKRDGIFRGESTYAQKSSPIRVYVYYELTSPVEFYLGKRRMHRSILLWP